MRYSVAEAVRQGTVSDMRGVEVKTRNNKFDHTGRRWCDIWLREQQEGGGR